jgi:hypothetical protein
MTDLEKAQQINEQIGLRADGRISVWCAGAWETSRLLASLLSRIEELERRLDKQTKCTREQAKGQKDAPKPEELSYLASTDSSLVNRVALAISRSASDKPSPEADEQEIFHWKPEAFAAVRAVADWLNDENNGIPSWTYLQLQKELEAQ